MKRYPVREKDLRIGAKHEMEHTTSERTARRIARDHLREHPSYYQVLPVAEKIMQNRERKIKPIRRKKVQPINMMTWVPKIVMPR